VLRKKRKSYLTRTVSKPYSNRPSLGSRTLHLSHVFRSAVGAPGHAGRRHCAPVLQPAGTSRAALTQALLRAVARVPRRRHTSAGNRSRGLLRRLAEACCACKRDCGARMHAGTRGRAGGAPATVVAAQWPACAPCLVHLQTALATSLVMTAMRWAQTGGRRLPMRGVRAPLSAPLRTVRRPVQVPRRAAGTGRALPHVRGYAAGPALIRRAGGSQPCTSPSQC